MFGEFSKKTLRGLFKKGIALMSKTMLPGEGDLPYATGETAYVVNDNGCGRIWTYRQVLEAAGE